MIGKEVAHAAFGSAFALWIERIATHDRCSYAEACQKPERVARATREAAAVAEAAWREWRTLAEVSE